MKKIRIAISALSLGLFASSPIFAKEPFGTFTDLYLNVKVDSDLTIGARVGVFTGNHHEQNPEIDNSVVYDSLGLSGTEYGLTASLFLGSIGKAKITGTGGFKVYDRVLADTLLSDTTLLGAPISSPGKFRCYYPSSGISISIPFGSWFDLEMNNTFERRLTTQPKPESYWFWIPQIRFLANPLTSFKLSPFIDYKGYDNEVVNYVATSSIGLKSEPIENLNFDLSYKLNWKPDGQRSNRISQVIVALGYTFDLSK